MRQDGGGEQAELLLRKIAARPGQLAAREVAARGEARLRELERREHEQIGALVVAPVARAHLGERGVERREVFRVAHGRNPDWGRSVTTRTPPDRRARSSGGSSARSSTSSIVSTCLMSSSRATSSGKSTRSLLLRAGTSTVVTPARAAAVSFSLSPPIGNTRPRSVSSPVIARS